MGPSGPRLLYPVVNEKDLALTSTTCEALCMTLRSWVLWFSICFNTPRLWRAFLFITIAWASTACEFRREPTKFISTTDTELLHLCEVASDRWHNATGIAVECLYGLGDKYSPLRWGLPQRPCAAANTGPNGITVRRDYSPKCDRESPVARPGYPDNFADWPRADVLEAVVVHEMGHAIAGWRENEHAESGIMSRVAYPGDPIDQASIDWLCASADCVWEEAE